MHMITFAVTDFKYRNNAAGSKLPMRVLSSLANYEKTQFPLVEGEKLMNALENYLQVPHGLPKIEQLFIWNIPETFVRNYKEFELTRNRIRMKVGRQANQQLKRKLYIFPGDRMYISDVSEGKTIQQHIR